MIVPGVTSLLDEFRKVRFNGRDYYYSTVCDSGLIDGEVFEAAGRFGTAIHEAAPLVFKGELNWANLDEAWVDPITQFLKWSRDVNLRDVEFEIKVFSRKNWFAGTLDIMATILNGERALIDIKTGMSTLVGPQTKAYEIAYREQYKYRKKLRRYVLNLPKDGSKYKFNELARGDDDIFFRNRRFQHNYLNEKGVKI